jgi:hypothetical protein
MQPAPPAKKSSWKLILGIAAGVVGLCCLGGTIIAIAGGDKNDAADKVGALTNPNQTQSPGAQQPAPAKSAALPPGSVTDKGTLHVGTDIAAGTYRGVGCEYWARMSSADGGLGSIKANEIVGHDEYATITLTAGEYFKTDCDVLFPVQHVTPVPADTTTSNRFGMLIVGVDLPAGTWRGQAQGDCYWARMRDFVGGVNSILANDLVDPGAKFTITVRPSDKGLARFRLRPLTRA